MEPLTDPVRKRVLFRSQHTGMKENNLLIGRFAEDHLATMSDGDVAWLEWLLLNHNDIDLYNWMLGKEPLPDALDHPVMTLLIETVRGH